MKLFLAGVRKLIRRPATYVTFGLLVALLALILLAVGATAGRPEAGANGQAGLLLVTFPGAYTFVLSFILGLGGLFGVIYGAAVAGSEWTWGTLKAAIARGESRTRYQLLSFAAIAALLAVGLLLAFAIGVLVAAIGATIAGVSTSGLGDSAALGKLPELFARGWVAMIEQAALGFAIATLARSQLAGIGAGIAVYFGEQFAAIFLPDIVKYLPFNAANAVVEVSGNRGAGGGAIISPLDPNAALLIVAGWLIGALIVTSLFTERAEISG
jgi:ABC-type transport system involved in multi-copper enzyme maturation permease subunit